MWRVQTLCSWPGLGPEGLNGGAPTCILNTSTGLSPAPITTSTLALHPAMWPSSRWLWEAAGARAHLRVLPERVSGQEMKWERVREQTDKDRIVSLCEQLFSAETPPSLVGGEGLVCLMEAPELHSSSLLMATCDQPALSQPCFTPDWRLDSVTAVLHPWLQGLKFVMALLHSLLGGWTLSWPCSALCRGAGHLRSLHMIVICLNPGVGVGGRCALDTWALPGASADLTKEEGQCSEVVQGVLLGLRVEDRLEITNCFPFPKHTEDDADLDEALLRPLAGALLPLASLFYRTLPHRLATRHIAWDRSRSQGAWRRMRGNNPPLPPIGAWAPSTWLAERVACGGFQQLSQTCLPEKAERGFGHTVQYEMEMMKSLRHVNIDHLHVGWYLSTFYGSFVIQTLLDSQFSYQHAIEESVVLIYDPIKMAQGPLSLKAYRLTPKLMDICMVKDFSKEGYVNQPVLVQTRPTQLCTVTPWIENGKANEVKVEESRSVSSCCLENSQPSPAPTQLCPSRALPQSCPATAPPKPSSATDPPQPSSATAKICHSPATAQPYNSPATAQPSPTTAQPHYSPAPPQPSPTTAQLRYSPASLQPCHSLARAPPHHSPGLPKPCPQPSPATLQPRPTLPQPRHVKYHFHSEREMTGKASHMFRDMLLPSFVLTHLEKSLQMLMDRVDDMSQEIVKYNDYSHSLRKQQQKHQYIQRRQQENAQRQSRGEALLPEDLNKLFKPPVPPLHMDTLLISGQINMYCQTLKEFTSQNLGKIFMAEALQSHGS
ncbi:hypothetical protein P4O66_019489 [Electrophorus voltai]|uniref:JAB1/MPN/MOV34 metalloenzyme domain-containing protein n=1 Tax=Electrophorus voltai TaxID=2609070 RepID=A0AAD9E5F4_9TELE|nr:hypothetical protein P4O66_019489 [Electrophorus voltai]